MIIPLIVIIYYFFRKKYIQQSVSSTLFWREIMKETKVSPYLQHLQRNALFYLQMIALLLMLFVLLQPYVKSKTISGEQIIWVVDTSSTMLAKEGNETIFEKHKNEMLALSKKLDSKAVTIVTVGAEPKIVLQEESNRARIERAIHQLQVTYSHENWSNTMDFLQSIIGKKSTTVYIFTDAIEQKQLPKRTKNIKWIVQGTDKKHHNISLQRFGAIQSAEGIEAIAQIENQTPKGQQTTLKIYNVNQEEIARKSINLKANQIAKVKLDKLKSTGALTARLTANDEYAADQSMSTLLATDTSQIFVDQSLHQLISKAFQSIEPSASTISSDQLASIQGKSILVTNHTDLLHQSKNPILLFGRDDKKAHKVDGKVKVLDPNLFSYASIEDIYVEKVYPKVENAKTLVTVGNTPLIQQTENGHIVVLMDLQMTDWALHPSFPLFLWSAKEKLTTHNSQIGTFKPEEKRAISLPNLQENIDIYASNNEYIKSIANGGSFVAPAKPGLYYVKTDSDPLYFVVALEQQEKTLSEGTSFQYGELSKQNTITKDNSIFSTIFIIIILTLLIVEWEVQRRYGFTN